MQWFATILLILLTIALDSGNRAREANRAYEQGDYQRAEMLYREILNDQPENRRILFNLGNALARQGKTEASIDIFERYRELPQEPAGRSPGEYNLGYLHHESGNQEEAVRHFRQAVTLDPSDEDAKYNFELLKRRQQSQPSDDGQDDSDQPEDQPEGAQPPPASDDDGQADEDDPGQQEPSPSDDVPQSDQDHRGGTPEIIKEQLDHAEDIMNALEQIEKDLIKDFKKRQLDPVEPHLKDW